MSLNSKLNNFPKRRFKETAKTVGSSLIFTAFLYQTIFYRWNPPFWLISLIFFTATFIAFARKSFKCFIILLIPTLISKRGRSAIVGYIFILTLTGSVVNIVKNIDVTVECLSCAQEHAKGIIEGIIRGLKRPFGDIKQMIAQIEDHILRFMEEIEDRLNAIKGKISFITKSIEKAFEWLKKISELCQESFGSPQEMCINSLEKMIDKCEEDLGIASFLCNLNYLLQPLCISMELLDFMCIAIDYIGESALDAIEKITEEFTNVVKKIFYFNLEFDSDFDFETSASSNWTQIRESISRELKKRTDKFISIVGFMEFFSLVFILWLFYKYQTQYVKHDDYKNYYITEYFSEMEEMNIQHGRDPVLPLRGEENDLYTNLQACRLIRYERRKLLRSFPFLLLSNVQILTILFTDYMLYWILTTIHDYENTHLIPISSGRAIIQVAGRGPLAEMYKSIVAEFDPILKGFTTDFRDCLPTPSPPNWKRIWTTIFLIVICWIFLLAEPLSLRVQQRVMDSFHPERARKRSAWLYGEILRRRSSFLAIARQKVLQVMHGEHQEEHQAGFFRNIWQKLRNTFIVNFFLGQQWQEFCLSCATPGNRETLQSCTQISCLGIFCSKCLSSEKFCCPLCSMEFIDERRLVSET